MKLILLTFLAACAANTPTPDAPAPVDAAPDAPTCSVKTWHDALAVWVDTQCTATERCFPQGFFDTWGDHATCVAQVLAQDCLGAEAYCASPYPAERCAFLAQCVADVALDECTVTDAPASCYGALE